MKTIDVLGWEEETRDSKAFNCQENIFCKDCTHVDEEGYCTVIYADCFDHDMFTKKGSLN